MKLLRRLSTLGYGSRREVQGMLRRGRVTDRSGRALGVRDIDDGTDVFVDGQPMDPRPTVVLVLNKPRGLETTRANAGPTVYAPLPPRFRLRSPTLAPVGRLDKDTSGLLLFTDDGTLLHRLTHPRHHVGKTYAFETARPIAPDTAERFASGQLQLRGDDTPLRPAQLVQTGPRTGRLTIHEGRYHQVRRMLAAVGNHVESLHRVQVGPLSLNDLAEGAWRYLTAAEQATLRAAVGLPT